jgi:alcohol dehydrogenase class IV
MTQIFNYLPIDSVSIGEQSVKEIADLIGNRRGQGAIIITSRSVSKISFFKRLVESLPESEVFSGITQHSPIEEIKKIVDEIKEKQVDFIISVGGGSVIDSTKVVRSILNPNIPQIAIPTTLSAAEFSHIAGYSEGGEKRGIRDKRLVPKYIFLDPNATIETPDTLWRSTGIRAIDHAVESTIGNGFTDIRVNLSEISVDKMMENLEGSGTDKRQECQIASWYSYFDVYDSEMGYSHKIGKIIGARWGIPHGLTSCISLPEMLRYYSERPSIGLSRLAISITGEKDGRKAVNALADGIEEFIGDLGLTKKLSDYGIKEEDLEFIMGKVGQNDQRFKEHLRNML